MLRDKCSLSGFYYIHAQVHTQTHTYNEYTVRAFLGAVSVTELLYKTFTLGL